VYIGDEIFDEIFAISAVSTQDEGDVINFI